MTITHAIAAAIAAAALGYLLLALAALASVARASRFRAQRDEARAQLAVARTKAAGPRRHVYLPPVSPVRRVHDGDALTRVINGRYR
jgi:hypothetical protein